jgi:hypothetical protein
LVLTHVKQRIRRGFHLEHCAAATRILGPRIRVEVVGRISWMLRFALYLSGVSAALAAWVVWGDRNSAARRVPVKKAAAMLQQAWADHHTQA